MIQKYLPVTVKNMIKIIFRIKMSFLIFAVILLDDLYHLSIWVTSFHNNLNKGYLCLQYKILKQIIAILISVSLCCQCLVQLGIFAWYEINKDYVARELCVNKNKPWMKCCGKCYLRKQLKKVSGNGDVSEKPGSQKSEQIEWVVFLIPESISIAHADISSVKTFNLQSVAVYHLMATRGIFRPPQIIA